VLVELALVRVLGQVRLFCVTVRLLRRSGSLHWVGLVCVTLALVCLNCFCRRNRDRETEHDKWLIYIVLDLLGLS
jgi:hypothetical protein